MSQTNSANQWTKRVNISMTCPSGKVVTVRRPGPEIALKGGKILRIFRARGIDPEKSTINQQLNVIETLSDDELNDLATFARAVLVNVMVDPPLSLKAKDGQLEPDDLPLGDFWFLAIQGMNGWPNAPVKLVDAEETTVAAVENFPEQQGAGANAGGDGKQVQPAPI